MKNKFLAIFFIISLVISLNLILAHEEDITETQSDIDITETRSDINSYIKSTSILYITIASIIVAIAITISIFYKNKTEKAKIILFLFIVLPIIIATLYLSGSTIYLNLVSESEGLVHWHADFEVWNCNNQLDIIDPTTLSNRAGTTVLHEHNDNRIHVEGVVVKKSNVDLHNFFDKIGGTLSNDLLKLPMDTHTIEMKNGELCNGQPAFLQVFLYKITNPDPKKKSGFQYTQTKLSNFDSYIISPYQNVPPGDCIIIEFDIPKNKTDKICESYKIAIEKGDITEAN